MARWKKIKDFPNYEVSDEGQVRNVKTGRILKGFLNTSRYLQVGLYQNYKRNLKLIHTLVLEAFVSICAPNKQCCHYDGDKINNNINNLRWGTRQDNYSDRFRHGTDNTGSKNGSAILTEEIVRKCRLLYAQNKSIISLAKIYGVTQSAMGFAISGKTWSHVK